MDFSSRKKHKMICLKTIPYSVKLEKRRKYAGKTVAT